MFLKMIYNLRETKQCAMLCTLGLLMQVAWINAFPIEAIKLLNDLRKNVPGNEHILPLVECPYNKAQETWQLVSLEPKGELDNICESIRRFHRVYTNEQVSHDFDAEIVEITKSDRSTVKYKLGKLLAKGTQGTVSIGCTTIGAEKIVAIKMIQISTDEEMLVAECEAEFHKDMQHVVDGVSVMLDCGTLVKDGSTFFVIIIELLDVDIYDVLTMCGGMFSLETSVTLIRQLLKTVREFHALRIVHRDLKAENLMLKLPTQLSPVKMVVVDFGCAENYELSPSKGETSSRVGTPDTMSIFTHKRLPVHPRDDLLSIWYILAIFIDGVLPWDKILNEKRKPGMSDDEYENMMQAILEKKLETSSTILTKQFPELADFINHILALEIGDVPDYAMLDKCLENVLKNRIQIKTYKFDWEVKGDMLFRNPNLMFISAIHVATTNSYRLRFETFYDSLVVQIEQLGREVQVLDELNDGANELLQLQQLPDGGFYARVFQQDMQDIRLASFYQWDEQMLGVKGLLFAGFSIRCDNGNCNVLMILKTNQEIWDTLSNFKKRVPYYLRFPQTQKMGDILNMQNNPDKPIDDSRYKQFSVQINNTQQYPFSVLEDEKLELLAAMVARNEISELGFNLNTTKTESGYIKVIVVVFRLNFNFVEQASRACRENGVNFSWSIDESAFDEERRFVLPNAKAEEVYEVEFESSNWKFARKVAVQNFLSNKKLDKGKLNIRVKWQYQGGKYIFIFIQDAFYEKLITGENPPKFEFGANWLSGTRITEGDWSLRQLANTIAGDMAVERRLGVDYRDGLYIISTTVDIIPKDRERGIFDVMSILCSVAAKEAAGVNHEEIGSAAFGYAVTAKYVYGVAIFETLGNSFLELVNRHRLLNQGIPALSLSHQNREWVRATIRKYNKGGLSTKSGNLLRTSANIVEQKSEHGAGDGEGISSVKGKNPLASSGSRFRSLSNIKGNSSRTLLTSSSNLLLPDREQDGAYKFDIPKDVGISIQHSIKLFWEQNIRDNKALSSPEYESICIAAFSGSFTTKVAFQLDKQRNDRLRV